MHLENFTADDVFAANVAEFIHNAVCLATGDEAKADAIMDLAAAAIRAAIVDRNEDPLLLNPEGMNTQGKDFGSRWILPE